MASSRQTILQRSSGARCSPNEQPFNDSAQRAHRHLRYTDYVEEWRSSPYDDRLPMENHMLRSPDVISGTRQALRRLAKAVVIITTRHLGQRFAMSATAVSELSMSPPSMLICINRSASIHLPLQAGAHFGINILHASHESISRACSGALKGEARFDVGSWLDSDAGVPYLRDAQATLICAQEKSLAYESHSIFIGRVNEAFYQQEVNPLIYANGRYGSWAAPCEVAFDALK